MRKRKYEEYRAEFGDRNSFSKTDHDATFMRMKEDHMLNGQLKPGYNIQIGTENGFVVGFDVFPFPTDFRTLIPHLENMKERLGTLPDRVIADAGYGSEENYAYLEQNEIDAIVKYSMWQKEQSRAWKKDPMNKDNWNYDEEDDSFRCPAGKRLGFSHEETSTTTTGFKQQNRIYLCNDCEGCGFRQQCTKSKVGRNVRRNEAMLRLKQRAKDRLASAEGKALMRKRSREVETVFGQFKANQGFRRFRLKGNSKVAVEWGLLAIGYNIRRLMAG